MEIKSKITTKVLLNNTKEKCWTETITTYTPFAFCVMTYMHTLNKKTAHQDTKMINNWVHNMEQELIQDQYGEYVWKTTFNNDLEIKMFKTYKTIRKELEDVCWYYMNDLLTNQLNRKRTNRKYFKLEINNLCVLVKTYKDGTCQEETNTRPEINLYYNKEMIMSKQTAEWAFWYSSNQKNKHKQMMDQIFMIYNREISLKELNII